MKTSSIWEFRYFLNFLDLYSGYLQVWFVLRKIQSDDIVVDIIWKLEDLQSGRLLRLGSINHIALKWMRIEGDGDYVG